MQEPLAGEDTPGLDSPDSHETLAEVGTAGVEKKTTSNSAIPGLALSQGVCSPVAMATEASQVDSKGMVGADSSTLSSNEKASQQTGKSIGDERMVSRELCPVGEDKDERNLNLLDPFRDEPDEGTESISTEPIANRDQHGTTVTTIHPSDLDKGQNTLDADVHVALPPLSPDATLPNSQSDKEHTEQPESLYDGNHCDTSDSKLPETSLMSSSSELPPEFPTAVRELEEGVNIGTQLPSQHQNIPIQPNITALLPTKSSPNSTPCKRQRLEQVEEESYCGQEQDEFAAVQEMMDLTAADLAMESQLLGEGGDEAMVPSCSPARLEKGEQTQPVLFQC